MVGQFEALRASPRLSHVEAIAAVLDSPHCPVEVIAELLAWRRLLRTSARIDVGLITAAGFLPVDQTRRSRRTHRNLGRLSPRAKQPAVRFRLPWGSVGVLRPTKWRGSKVSGVSISGAPEAAVTPPIFPI
jgi:hypothetical protein